ncbi:hypothetical protein [Spirochaeta cellobiosiphila]|uniref:hypothetical protein n=1 Tax=Spirochaeta cellobiosiphila TaxID=504483 RepID=UPI000417AE50|nr:hypothetical protein [Spirochaeta cellobiosiphila]
MDYKHYYKEGKRSLKSHSPKDAIRSFTKAIHVCPVAHKQELSKILYYLGFALQKLNLSGSALKTWRAGQKLRVCRSFDIVLKRYLNSYGMIKQPSSLLDDWKAFFSIQLEKYLNTKSSRRIGTLAEGDMIQQLLWEHFMSIHDEGSLIGKPACEKKRIFMNTRIIFPYINVPDGEKANTIRHSFVETKKSKEIVCDCGAELSSSLCCRITPGDDELQSGVY